MLHIHPKICLKNYSKTPKNTNISEIFLFFPNFIKHFSQVGLSLQELCCLVNYYVIVYHGLIINSLQHYTEDKTFLDEEGLLAAEPDSIYKICYIYIVPFE